MRTFHLFFFDRYDTTTATFTVPPGGDGFYYFATYVTGDNQEIVYFDVEINGNLICTILVDAQDTSADYPQSGCSATTYAFEGT